MTTYILEGGLGNLLFQLNYYNACQKFLTTSGHGDQISLGIINCFARKLYFKSSSANDNRDISVLSQLTGSSPARVFNSSAMIKLGLSKFTGSPFLGFVHDKYSLLSIESSLAFKCVFTYGHNGVPISLDLLNSLRSTLVNSVCASNIRNIMEANAYEAVLHFRAGDTKSIQSLNTSYFLNACQGYNKVLVITNDQGKARSVFNERKFQFLAKHQSLIADIIYMVNARAFIGSNSTLSWWASEISQNEQVVHFPAYRSLSDYFCPASNKSRILYEIY